MSVLRVHRFCHSLLLTTYENLPLPEALMALPWSGSLRRCAWEPNATLRKVSHPQLRRLCYEISVAIVPTINPMATRFRRQKTSDTV
jgi:hypothetical protein